MKRLAPHINNKRGSMLMLTLIVFMVILILGMTMITSMLYSQGENNMQINEQKAYYAALSAVDSVKAYFLNSTLDESTMSLHKLIEEGKLTCTYNLKDKGIDEDTDVTIEIRDGGQVPNESSKNYIVIEATGTCQGEKSTVTARMIEEEQKGGSTGIYDSKVIFGSGRFDTKSGAKLKFDGNIFINDAMTDNRGVYLHSMDALSSDANGEGNTIYINAKQSDVVIDDGKFNNIFMQCGSQITVKNNSIDNLYIRSIPGSSGGTQIENNDIRQQGHFFLDTRSFQVLRNTFSLGNKDAVNPKFIIGANVETVWRDQIQYNEVEEVYIKGAKKIDGMIGKSDDFSQILYSDAQSYGSNFVHINDKIKTDLSYLEEYEQKIKSTVEGEEEIQKVLETKPLWDRSALPSSFVEVAPGQGPYIINNEHTLKEYHDSDNNIRLIFTDYNYYYTVQKKQNYNDSDNPEQVFFIAEKAMGIDFYMSEGDKYEAFYLYAPNAQCQVHNNFEYFNGSLIAKIINIFSYKGEFTFRAPENIDGIGVPGVAGSTGGSGTTTYTYHFEEYIENDKDES